ncbi:hypothetical protein MKX03_000894 [Papaver bracteatum]|nr:hypothetical protein MKX03_000894 [Papaver bracteatum]
MENGIPENPIVLPSKRKCTEDQEIEDLNKKNKPEIVNDGGEKNQNSEEKSLNGEKENHEKGEEEVNGKGKGAMIKDVLFHHLRSIVLMIWMIVILDKGLRNRRRLLLPQLQMDG